MAAIKNLSNPTLRINNVIILPKANTLSVITGKGEKSVKGVSSGAGFSNVVVSEDVETKVGKIKFELFTTAENYELVRGWQSVELTIGNTITVSEDDFHATLVGAIIVNDPEEKFGMEESFEVEFCGPPVI